MLMKVLTSITYAETSVPNESGEDFPQEAGTLYHFPMNYSVLGQRLALLLYDKQVKLFEQDKITIVFSTYLEPGTTDENGRLSHNGSRYITIGVSANAFNTMTYDDRIAYLLKTTKDILEAQDVAGQYHQDIEEAVSQVLLGGEELDLVYQRKKDQKVEVDVLLNLFDSGMCRISSIIKSSDGRTIQRDHVDDVHCLSVAQQRCGSILIRKNKIIIKPQKNILSKEFEPIEINY